VVVDGRLLDDVLEAVGSGERRSSSLYWTLTFVEFSPSACTGGKWPSSGSALGKARLVAWEGAYRSESLHVDIHTQALARPTVRV
jgi:hypothetical protein